MAHRYRGGSLLVASGRCDRSRRRGASLTRGICDASLGRCCASPQMIIEEPVQRLPHGGEISSTITSEPLTSDQHVDFGLAQLNRDASQPLSSAITMPGHAVSARRGDGTTGRANAYWVFHIAS